MLVCISLLFHLPRLSGTTHQVVTGVVILLKPKGGAKLSERVFHVTTDVCFATLSEDIIKAYVDSGEPMYVLMVTFYTYCICYIYLHMFTIALLRLPPFLPPFLSPFFPTLFYLLPFLPPFLTPSSTSLPPSLDPSLLSPCVQGQSRSVSNGTHHILMVTFVSLSTLSTCCAAHFSIIGSNTCVTEVAYYIPQYY